MSLTTFLTNLAADAFAQNGIDRQYGEVVVSNRPDLAQFQCNGALPAAKPYKKNPREIAQSVVDVLTQNPIFKEVGLAGPGFINLILTDEFLLDYIGKMAADEQRGVAQPAAPHTVIVDYGGANIAKPLHVGHLRAAIIGECIKRVSNFLDYKTLGDVHMGDWGLPMGQLIVEIARDQPDLPYFDADYAGPYPTDSPVTVEELGELYPIASGRAKDDPAVMDAARRATYELQGGRPGYLALWQHFWDISVAELKRDYGALNVQFDLWLGESDTRDRIDGMVEQLGTNGHAQKSDGALIIDVSLPDDSYDIPPLILVKSDGAVMYGTTDLATIDQRMADYQPDEIIYVVDNRQSDHFRQVFRAAYKTGIAPEAVVLEHAGFGTMNGKDGRPFKTRAGGVLRLRTLIDMVMDAARERMDEAGVATGYPAAEKDEVARMVGVAALKYADMMNGRNIDYVFDLERFSSFEGRTGPYLLYTAARIKSILRTAAEQTLTVGPLAAPADDIERTVLLTMTELPDVIQKTFALRAPNHLCEYAYKLAAAFNHFYSDHHILGEEDPVQQASWLALAQVTVDTLVLVLDLLGIETPERM